jgi:hypothetical protein
MKRLSLLSGIIVKLKFSRRFGKRISARRGMNALINAGAIGFL